MRKITFKTRVFNALLLLSILSITAVIFFSIKDAYRSQQQILTQINTHIQAWQESAKIEARRLTGILNNSIRLKSLLQKESYNQIQDELQKFTGLDMTVKFIASYDSTLQDKEDFTLENNEMIFRGYYPFKVDEKNIFQTVITKKQNTAIVANAVLALELVDRKSWQYLLNSMIENSFTNSGKTFSKPFLLLQSLRNLANVPHLLIFLLLGCLWFSFYLLKNALGKQDDLSKSIQSSYIDKKQFDDLQQKHNKAVQAYQNLQKSFNILSSKHESYTQNIMFAKNILNHLKEPWLPIMESLSQNISHTDKNSNSSQLVDKMDGHALKLQDWLNASQTGMQEKGARKFFRSLDETPGEQKGKTKLDEYIETLALETQELIQCAHNLKELWNKLCVDAELIKIVIVDAEQQISTLSPNPTHKNQRVLENKLKSWIAFYQKFNPTLQHIHFEVNLDRNVEIFASDMVLAQAVMQAIQAGMLIIAKQHLQCEKMILDFNQFDESKPWDLTVSLVTNASNSLSNPSETDIHSHVENQIDIHLLLARNMINRYRGTIDFRFIQN